MKFAREVKEAGFEARAALAGRDAKTLAAEILAMSEEDFHAAFKHSPMKRAKVGGLKRNATTVVSGRPA